MKFFLYDRDDRRGGGYSDRDRGGYRRDDRKGVFIEP